MHTEIAEKKSCLIVLSQYFSVKIRLYLRPRYAEALREGKKLNAITTEYTEEKLCVNSVMLHQRISFDFRITIS